MKKRALVSGGSGDIGRAICHQLAGDGLHVIVHANAHPERAEAVVAAIEQAGGSGEAVTFDLTDHESTERELSALVSDQPVQIVVHNAGVHDDAPLAGMRHEQWRRVIDVNLNGFFNLTRPMLLPMISSRWGRVIAISSVTAVRGNRGQANYAAAKTGLHGAVRCLALEVASRGVTVNAVAPGLIAGAIADATFTDAQVKTLVPMRRTGKPEEVASLVGFLAGEQAGYISGQIISINGAMG